MPRIPDLLVDEYRLLLSRGTPSPVGPSEQDFRPVSNQQFEIATVYLIITPIFQVLATLVFFARAYTRIYPTWRCGVDDYIIAVAFVFMTVMWALQFDGAMWAFGFNHPAYRSLESVEMAIRNGVIALPFWAWATGLVKISIATMLLKFQQSRIWRVFVYAMIILNVFFISYLGVAYIFKCTPYSSQWDLSPAAAKPGARKCWSKAAGRSTIYVTISCCVISDVILSLVPLTFLRKVRRPLREKVVIGALMALGVSASAFSFGRLVSQKKPEMFTDGSANAIFSGIMTCLEVQVSLIAACIPMLRSSANRWLNRMGLWRGSSNDSYQRYGPDRDTHSSHGKQARGVIELNHISPVATTFGTVTGTARTRDSGHESGQFVMDPATGRIMRATDVKAPKTSSSMHDDWSADLPGVVVEDWGLKRGIGYAR